MLINPERMTRDERRRELRWWDIAAGLLVALPFFGLLLLSLHEIKALGAGNFWFMSRTGIKLYCLAVIGAGLSLAGVSAPLIVTDRPDSARLRGWSLFITGVGIAIAGALMRWYLLAARNYEHPSTGPFHAMRLLVVAWLVLTVCSLYARRLEQRAKTKRPDLIESAGSAPTES